VIPERVSAIVFDIDGVLVDSAADVERAWRRWAAELNVAAADVLAVAHGRPAREIVRMFAPHLNAEQEAMRVSRRQARAARGLSAFPGAVDCVAIARNGPWAVVTSCGRNLAIRRLVTAGLPLPRVLITADDVVFGKPDPEPYQRACRALAVPPAECVVVEDTPAGIRAAKGAGMTVLAVTTTYSRAALQEADQVFTSLHEVAAQLRSSSPPRDDPADGLRSIG
jgi:sugar-phosphatase